MRMSSIALVLFCIPVTVKESRKHGESLDGR